MRSSCLRDSIFAGVIGAVTGLGGGVVIVPLLTLVFHVDWRLAVGASIVSVIATSSASAIAYVREGYTNIRMGMFLEIATSIGAVAGAVLAHVLRVVWLEALFGVVLIFSGIEAIRATAQDAGERVPSDRLASKLGLGGFYPGPVGYRIAYGVRNVPFGFALMGVAGALSGMLGIGSGAFKVLAMDRVMHVPFKVSTTTINFMIGVTAAASASVYLVHGDIDPRIAGPVMLGVLLGALLGTRLLMRWRSQTIRVVFAVVLGATGIYMLWHRDHSDSLDSLEGVSTLRERQLDIMIAGVVLRIGVGVAALLVVVGFTLMLAEHRGGMAHIGAQPQSPHFPPIALLFREAFRQGRPSALIDLGLVTLVMTPVFRVLASMVVFLYEQDHRYVYFTMIVLAVLIYSLAGG